MVHHGKERGFLHGNHARNEAWRYITVPLKQTFTSSPIKWFFRFTKQLVTQGIILSYWFIVPLKGQFGGVLNFSTGWASRKCTRKIPGILAKEGCLVGGHFSSFWECKIFKGRQFFSFAPNFECEEIYSMQMNPEAQSFKVLFCYIR